MRGSVRSIFLMTTVSILFFGAGVSDAQRKADTREFSDTFVKTADTVFAPLYGPLAEHIVARSNCGDMNGVGIDVGGGAGNLAVELAKRTPGMRWISLDINPTLQSHVARHARNAGVSGRVGSVTADVHTMPFPDGYADIIVSRGSFQQWDDQNKAFSEIYRVLKPGGYVYIGRGFSENLPVATARDIRTKQGGGPRYDKARTARDLERIARSLGVREYTVHVPDPAGDGSVNYGVWLEFRKPEGTSVSSGNIRLAAAGDNEENVYVFEPVDVTGSRVRDIVAEPLTESAGLELSSSTVERAEMEKQGAKTIIDALEYVPGAWVESRGRKVKQFFSVRGQKYPYPEYAIDGALYREFHETPYFFSAANVERIEVMRSSAAMLSGISGMTGVVNIVPRSFDRPETSWEVEYGSFDSYRAALNHGGKVGDVSYSLGVDTPHTDGPSGKNAAENMSNFNGSMTWQVSPKLMVKSSLFHINGMRELTLAEEPATAKLLTTVSRFDPFRTTFATVRTQYRRDETTATDVMVYYADRDNTYTTITGTGTDDVRERDYEFGANAVQSFGLAENNILRVGGYYNRWRAPNGKRFYVGRKCDLETGALAIVDEHRIGALTMDAGLRLARTYIHDYGAFNIDGTGGAFKKVEPVENEWEPVDVSASFGASYLLTPAVSLHANIAAGVVQPRSGTVTADGSEPDDENRIKLDVGASFAGDRLGEVSLVGFVTDQKNAIALSGGTVAMSDGRILELYENRDQRQLGIELDAKSRPLYRIASLFFNTVAMDPRADIDGDMKLDEEMPRFITSGGVYGVWKKWDANLFWKYVSSYESTRFAATTEPVSLGDFNSLNMTIGRTFGRSLSTRVYCEIRNLTDDEYSTVVGYPDFGRRFTVGIRQNFH